MDKFMTLNVVIKAENDWRGVGLLQVAMHSQLPRFLVAWYGNQLFLIVILLDAFKRANYCINFSPLANFLEFSP